MSEGEQINFIFSPRIYGTILKRQRRRPNVHCAVLRRGDTNVAFQEVSQVNTSQTSEVEREPLGKYKHTLHEVVGHYPDQNTQG